MASICALFFEHDLHGFHQIDEIEPNRPVANVPRVHLHALVIGGVAASADLPKPRDAGRHKVVVRDKVAVSYDFLLHDGARSDEAHLAANDVEDLRELVEARTTEKMPDARDAGIVFEFKIPLPFFAGLRILREVLRETGLRVLHHGAKLIAGKRPPIPPDASMRKNHRAGIVDIDRDGDAHHHR